MVAVVDLGDATAAALLDGPAIGEEVAALDVAMLAGVAVGVCAPHPVAMTPERASAKRSAVLDVVTSPRVSSGRASDGSQ